MGSKNRTSLKKGKHLPRNVQTKPALEEEAIKKVLTDKSETSLD